MKNKWLLVLTALVAAFWLTVCIVSVYQLDRIRLEGLPVSVWHRPVADIVFATVLLTFVTAYPLGVAITALLRRRKKSVEDKVPLSRLGTYMLYVCLGFWLLVLGQFICPSVSYDLVNHLTIRAISFFGWMPSLTSTGFLLRWSLAYFLLSAITVLIFYQLIIRFKESHGKTLVFDLVMILMIIVVACLWDKDSGSLESGLDSVGNKHVYLLSFNGGLYIPLYVDSEANVAAEKKKNDGVFVIASPIDHRYQNIDEKRSFRCDIYDVLYSCDDKAIRAGDRILVYGYSEWVSSFSDTVDLRQRLFPGRVFLDRATSKTYNLMFPYDETISGLPPDVDINDQMTVYSGNNILVRGDSFPVDVFYKDDFREALEEFKQHEIKRRGSGTTAAVNGG